MKLRNFTIRILGAICVAALAMSGCGSDKDLTINPVGPTIVEKGTTLQFTANKSDVTWSVEGGNSNGTISAGGLYTPPANLPLGVPNVTVQAEDGGGNIAEGVVSLRTADDITLGDPIPVNPTPLNGLGLSDFGIGFMSNRIAVGLGSVHEMSVFTGDNGGAANVFLATALDFSPFSAVNLTDDVGVSEFSSAIEIDSQLNPHILFARGMVGTEARLMMASSPDQGASFGEAVPITSSIATNFVQIMGFLAQDGQGGLHVVFSSLNGTDNMGAIVYTRSTDGGQTWSEPKDIKTGEDNLVFPSVAVNADGSKVYVPYYDGGIGQIFFARSEDGGANFSEPVPISVATTIAPPFSKAVLDTSGNLYIGIADDLDGDNAIEAVLLKSTDGGASFAPGMQINHDPTNTTSVIVNIAVDSLGRIDAVWGSDPDGSGDFDTLNYARSVDGGATFSDAETLASGSAGSALLTRGMRHDQSGRLYIQYLVSDPSFTSGNIFIRRGE